MFLLGSGRLPDIDFDEASATSVCSRADDIAVRLRGLGPRRYRVVDDALEDFSGVYAQLFQGACEVDREDRLALAGVFESVADQVRDAIDLARQERERISEYNEWQEREFARMAERVTAQSFGGGAFGVRSTVRGYGEVCDPEPSTPVVMPPSISCSLLIRERVRCGSGASMATSSASVCALRGFVSYSQLVNADMRDDYDEFRLLWKGFTSSCSWVSVQGCNILAGFDAYIEQNELDAMWIGNIADLFELAGGVGGLPRLGYAQVTDSVLSLAHDLVDRYRHTRKVVSVVDILIEKDYFWAYTYFHGRVFTINPVSGLSAPKGSWGYERLARVASVREVTSPHLTATPKVGKPPTWLKRAGSGLSVLSAGLTYYDDFSTSYNENQLEHPEWTDTQKIGDAAKDSVVEGTASLAGGWAGAKGGAALGAAIGSIFPGPGTLIGGIVGGLIGGIAGSTIGEKIGEGLNDFFFE